MRLAYMGWAASTALWASTLDPNALYSSTKDQLHKLCKQQAQLQRRQTIKGTPVKAREMAWNLHLR